MIIDTHRHLVAREWFSERFWLGFARMAIGILKQMGMNPNPQVLLEQILPLIFDPEGEKHLAQMAEAKVDKSVLFLFDVGLFVGEPDVTIVEQNRAVFNAAKKYPDKFIPFASTDPRRPGAKDFVRKCFEEYGAKGLKLHPGAGFNPESKPVLELMEVAAGFGAPVVVHTGPSVPPTSSRFTAPVYLDTMLLEYPDTPVIAAHMGYGYYPQILSLGAHRPNLYVDIAAWQTTAFKRYPEFAAAIRAAVDQLGPQRILFATDSPFLWPVLSEPAYVTAVKELTSKPPEHCRLTDREVEMILGLNAERLLA